MNYFDISDQILFIFICLPRYLCPLIMFEVGSTCVNTKPITFRLFMPCTLPSPRSFLVKGDDGSYRPNGRFYFKHFLANCVATKSRK